MSTLVLGHFIVDRLFVSKLCLESNPPVTPSIRPDFAVCAQRLHALITSGCGVTASRFVLVLILRQLHIKYCIKPFNDNNIIHMRHLPGVA